MFFAYKSTHVDKYLKTMLSFNKKNKKGKYMAFKLDEKNFMISGYKGDSASFTFKVNSEISDYSLCFYVKKNINDPEEKAIFTKEFVNPVDNTAVLELSSEDTSKFLTKNSCFHDYYWSLKIKNNNGYVQTLIPNNFEEVPVFRVYP